MALTLTNSLLRDYVQHLTGKRPPEGVLCLIGIRSARPYKTEPGEVSISIQPPRENQYDDWVGFFGKDLWGYPGTTDPGRNWTLYPMRPSGCAHVADGGPYLQRIGTHKGKAAFVQDGPIYLWRDTNKNNAQDANEPTHPETGNGLNIHRMGRKGPGVNSWSAGCLGVITELWPAFWERSAVLHPQPSFNLYVIDGPKLGTWFDTER